MMASGPLFTQFEDDYILRHGVNLTTSRVLRRPIASLRARLRKLTARNKPPPKNTRKCLCCGRGFVSEGAGHRVCDACKKTARWSGGGDYSLAGAP